MIPVVNNELYPRWFPLDLLCLHSSVLCKNPVTSLYLAGVSANFLIVFCIKSLMLDLTLHSDPTQPLLCASVCQIHPKLCPPVTRDPFHADKGAQRVCCSFHSHRSLLWFRLKQSLGRWALNTIERVLVLSMISSQLLHKQA